MINLHSLYIYSVLSYTLVQYQEGEGEEAPWVTSLGTVNSLGAQGLLLLISYLERAVATTAKLLRPVRSHKRALFLETMVFSSRAG